MKITNSSLAQGRRIFRLCLENGVLNEKKLSKVVQLLSKNSERQSRSLLLGISKAFRHYSSEKTALIISANDLINSEKKMIMQKIKEDYGSHFNVDFKVDPRLLGGLKIQIGDNVWDGSLLGKVNQLGENLTKKL